MLSTITSFQQVNIMLSLLCFQVASRSSWCFCSAQSSSSCSSSTECARRTKVPTHSTNPSARRRTRTNAPQPKSISHKNILHSPHTRPPMSQQLKASQQALSLITELASGLAVAVANCWYDPTRSCSPSRGCDSLAAESWTAHFHRVSCGYSSYSFICVSSSSCLSEASRSALLLLVMYMYE